MEERKGRLNRLIFTFGFYVPYLETVFVVHRNKVLSKRKQNVDIPFVPKQACNLLPPTEGLHHLSIGNPHQPGAARSHTLYGRRLHRSCVIRPHKEGDKWLCTLCT